MGKIISSLLGGAQKAPKVSTAPVASTEDAARKAKKSRAALFETEGGVAGQELDPGAVSQRSTLLGN